MVCLKCDHRRPKAEISSEASGEPLLEHGGCRENNKFRFSRGNTDGNTQPSLRQRRQIRDDGADMWRFVEDESGECSRSKSLNEGSGFVDFPIAGGKSDFSQNEEKKERWKLEMLERSKGTFKGKNDDESESASIHKSLESSESTDDEEMAGWFGHGKFER